MALLLSNTDELVRGVAGASGPDLTRYFLVCGSLLAIVGVLAFLARRYLVRHVKQRARRRSLQVVDVLPLGRRQKLCVVRCYDRTFLLGMGDREVRSIAELDAEEVAGEAGVVSAQLAGEPPESVLVRTQEELAGKSFGERFIAALQSNIGGQARRDPSTPRANPDTPPEVPREPRAVPSPANQEPERVATPWKSGEGVLG